MGQAGQGPARRGTRIDPARQGEAWHGAARRDQARPGEAWRGWARQEQGKERGACRIVRTRGANGKEFYDEQ